jgi:osmotically-inducible protein OsmY
VSVIDVYQPSQEFTMEATATPTNLSTDLDLEAAVRDAILELDNLRPTQSEVTISVTNGQVRLTGIVPSRMIAAEVERVARTVPGVTEVSNELLDDGSLTLQLARTLATDPRTRAIPPGYKITSVFGHITLVGDFADEQVHQMVIDVCQSVHGVRSVKIVQT